MKRRLQIIIMLIIGLMCLCACTPKDNEKKNEYELGGKTYYNTVDNYGHEDHSKVWFGKDGSFVFNDSYEDGYDEITGKWELSDNVCTLQADSGSFSKIIFELKDENTVTLRTSLKGSKADDAFSTTEIKGSDVKPKTDNTENNTTQNTTNNTTENTTDNSTTPKEEIPCTGITSLYKNYWSTVGAKKWDLEIRPVPENTTDKMSFKSNDENVVTIDAEGKATAVGPGKTTIDVTCGNQKLTVGFEVKGGESSGPEGAGVAKTFKTKMADLNDMFQPSVFFDSGFFTFTENCYDSMRQYKGIYDIKDGYYYLTVSEHNLQGYAGQDVTEIVFKIVDEKTLKLKTQLCMSTNGDLFYLTD